jgi:hypothetical protein
MVKRPRKAYLRTLIGAIIVGDKSVKIVGSKEAVKAAILGKPGPSKRSWFGTGMAHPAPFERVFSGVTCLGLTSWLELRCYRRLSAGSGPASDAACWSWRPRSFMATTVMPLKALRSSP